MPQSLGEPVCQLQCEPIGRSGTARAVAAHKLRRYRAATTASQRCPARPLAMKNCRNQRQRRCLNLRGKMLEYLVSQLAQRLNPTC